MSCLFAHLLDNCGGDLEYSLFMQKWSYFLCRIEFVPVYERSKVVQLKDLFVLELTVSAGHEDEIYETGEHKVFRAFDWRCVFFNDNFCKAVKWDQNSDLF